MSGRTNIVLILTDQQRADFLRSEGFGLDTMPFLDALSGQGVRFRRAYTPTPVCAPARCSLFSGRFPKATRVRENGGIRNIFRAQDLVEILRQRGYSINLAGKNHSNLKADDFDFYAAPYWHEKGARPRARELGVMVGVLPPGPLDAITDVAGVAVGQTTLIRGEQVRTGVTAILAHRGNLFQEKVPGAVFVGNGFGKLTGSTQVNELGEIETPILLTSTLSVPRVADALIDYMLQLPGNEAVWSINPLVAETNDGYLNDIRGRHIGPGDVIRAIQTATGGPVEEGTLGAGTGTIAFGLKGGIGTASRHLPAALVLVSGAK